MMNGHLSQCYCMDVWHSSTSQQCCNVLSLHVFFSFMFASLLRRATAAICCQQLSPQCDNMLIRCQWQGVERPCMVDHEMFEFVPTQHGYCCVFNSISHPSDAPWVYNTNITHLHCPIVVYLDILHIVLTGNYTMNIISFSKTIGWILHSSYGVDYAGMWMWDGGYRPKLPNQRRPISGSNDPTYFIDNTGPDLGLTVLVKADTNDYFYTLYNFVGFIVSYYNLKNMIVLYPHRIICLAYLARRHEHTLTAQGCCSAQHIVMHVQCRACVSAMRYPCSPGLDDGNIRQPAADTHPGLNNALASRLSRAVGKCDANAIPHLSTMRKWTKYFVFSYSFPVYAWLCLKFMIRYKLPIPWIFPTRYQVPHCKCPCRSVLKHSYALILLHCKRIWEHKHIHQKRYECSHDDWAVSCTAAHDLA